MICCHLPTHQQSQGPTTKGGPRRLLSIVGRTLSPCLSFLSLCWDFQIFVFIFLNLSFLPLQSSLLTFGDLFLFTIFSFYLYMFSLFSDLPILLQFLVALCFLELKTHLLQQARLSLLLSMHSGSKEGNAILSMAKEVSARISKTCRMTIAADQWFPVLP